MERGKRKTLGVLYETTGAKNSVKYYERSWTLYVVFLHCYINPVKLKILKIFLYQYCKLVKVQTLCILCNNWCLFGSSSLMPDLSLALGVILYTALVEFPYPNKIDCFVHTDRDRKTELLSLSLRYQHELLTDKKSTYICNKHKSSSLL